MDSFVEKQHRLEDLMPLIREQLAEGKTIRFSPMGTSMLPMLRQGIDRVILSPVPPTLKKYDLPLYRRENGQYVLHRIIRAGETYTCMGDNQFQPEPGLRHDQMIALVTAFTREGREIPVTAWQYRLYCRFWYHTRLLRRIYRGVKFRLRRLLT